MEVSALQMSVDSSGVVKGSGDLNKLSSSATKAAADAAKVEKAMGGVNTAASRAAASVASAAKSNVQLSSTFSQSDAHIKAYNENLIKTEAAANKAAAAKRALSMVMSGVFGFAVFAAVGAIESLVRSLLSNSDASEKAKKSTLDFTDTLDFRRMSVVQFTDAINQLEDATKSLINTQAIANDMLAKNAQLAAGEVSRQISEVDKEIARLDASNWSGSSKIKNIISDLQDHRESLILQSVRAQASAGIAQMSLVERAADEAVDKAMGATKRIERQIAELRKRGMASRAADVNDPIAAAQRRNALGDQYISEAQYASEYQKLAQNLYDSNQRTRTPRKPSTRKTPEMRVSDLLRDIQMETDAQKLRLETVGKTTEAEIRAERQRQLLNQATKYGAKITPELSAKIERLSTEYAKAKIAADVAIAIEGVTDALDKQHRTLTDEISLIGKYGDELTRAKNELEALRQAQNSLPKGVDINSPDMAGYRADVVAAAGQNSDTEIAKRQRENAERIRRQGELDIAQLDSQRGAIGLTGEALLKYNYVQNEVLKAQREGNKLSDEEMIKLNEAAEGYARKKHELDQLNESIALGRDVIGGFFSDWMQGMRNGGNVFKTFLNSVLDGLNKLAQKLTDRMISNFLDTLGGGGGGGGGILGAVGSLVSGNRPSNADPSGILKFANGGAFTNQIVSTPTLFRFANGGALGEMGEAGPEAIMPLKRGPSGALGVQAHGGGEMTITIRGDAGPLFKPTVTDIANESAARVVVAGLNEFNDMLPDRIQQISDDPRLR